MWREQAQRAQEAYETLTKTLLGVMDSPPQPVMTSSGSPPPTSTGPADIFEGLSPEIQETLLREYSEHLATFSTLSGKPPRANPLVEQIVPGILPNEMRSPVT
jgi:hypothetical protein